MSDFNVTFTRLSQLSHEYGAPAVSAAERVIQHSAQGQIIVGVCSILGTVLTASVSIFCGAYLKRYDLNGSIAFVVSAIFGCVFGGMATCALIVSAFANLSDIWAWTALSDPQLALAHQIFGSMGGQ